MLTLLEALLLPPGGALALIVLGLLLWPLGRALAAVLITLGAVFLYAASAPITAAALMSLVEAPASVQLSGTDPARAIIVLGGGRYDAAPEYGGADTVARFTLERLRYAARLHRQTGLPVLVTGGNPHRQALPEAMLMKRVLEEDFRVPVRWTEEHSATTWENAQYSTEILRAQGINRAYLVTHAWHMPRAMASFDAAGLTTVPAPTAYTTRGPIEQGLGAWLPNSRALQISALALHEMLGHFWYRLRHDY